jgi:hypothetical protein
MNSKDGIDADYSFSFKLIEYGRQKCSALQKLGYLDVLTSRDAVQGDDLKNPLIFLRLEKA